MLSAVLLIAFAWLPGRLAGATAEQRTDLDALTGRAIVSYWRTGRSGYPPALSELVDYWRRFHMVKALIAAALLITLCALVKVLWRRALEAPSRRALTAVVAAGALALAALALVLANIQGAVAPLSSLLSTLPLGHDRAVDGTAEAIHRALAAGDPGRPPLDRMVDDFSRYHAMVAVGAGLIAIILGAASIQTLRRSPAGILRRPRASAFAILATLMLILCLANTATAANPAPALDLLFRR